MLFFLYSQESIELALGLPGPVVSETEVLTPSISSPVLTGPQPNTHPLKTVKSISPRDLSTSSFGLSRSSQSLSSPLTRKDCSKTPHLFAVRSCRIMAPLASEISEQLFVYPEYIAFRKNYQDLLNMQKYLRDQLKSNLSTSILLSLKIRRLQDKIDELNFTYASLRNLAFAILETGNTMLLNSSFEVVNPDTGSLCTTIENIISLLFPLYIPFIEALYQLNERKPLDTRSIIQGLEIPTDPDPRRDSCDYTDSEYDLAKELYLRAPNLRVVEAVLQTIFSQKLTSAMAGMIDLEFARKLKL